MDGKAFLSQPTPYECASSDHRARLAVYADDSQSVLLCFLWPLPLRSASPEGVAAAYSSWRRVSEGHMGRHHGPLALSLTPCCHLLGKNLQGQDQIRGWTAPATLATLQAGGTQMEEGQTTCVSGDVKGLPYWLSQRITDCARSKISGVSLSVPCCSGYAAKQ